jgi:hypothetical protein
MLNNTLEFLRIADPEPTGEKVRNRRESAKALLDPVKRDRDIFLPLLLGVVTGFDSAPFTQDSRVVAQLISAIKELDATLPRDLTENAVELRAVAGIVVGELLVQQAKGTPTNHGILAAQALRSALTLSPVVGDKFIRWMLDTLLRSSDEVLHAAAQFRRKRGTPALRRLAGLKEATAATDLWATVMPAVNSALREATAQAEIDREEIETLWWMFAAHSELENEAIVDLEPPAAAFCSGVELAQRALLPPSPSSIAMIKRAVELGRGTTTLVSISFQAAAKHWSQPMLTALSPVDGSTADAIVLYPALLPLSWACRRLRESRGAGQKLGKNFTVFTGLPASHSYPAADWGAQVFRERILQRMLADNEER